MRKLTFQELQRAYLLKLYELTDGNAFQDIERSVLNESLGITEQKESELLVYFKYGNLIEFTFSGANLQPEGIIFAEEYMAQDYADKELLVLKTIYEMGKNKPKRDVLYVDLLYSNATFKDDELNSIIEELERKGFLGKASDECVRISPQGMEFIEGKSNMPNHQSSRDVYNTYINAPSNNLIGGKSNTQNAQINLNPEFDNAIKSIVDLIQASSISGFKKDDLLSNVEHIKQLPSSEPSVELVEHAKSKINYLDAAVKGTDIAVKVVPYLPALITYFEGLIK